MEEEGNSRVWAHRKKEKGGHRRTRGGTIMGLGACRGLLFLLGMLHKREDWPIPGIHPPSCFRRAAYASETSQEGGEGERNVYGMKGGREKGRKEK